MNKVFTEDCLTGLTKLAAESVDCVVTSPPYFRQRDYGIAGQIGLESGVDQYVNSLVATFREAKKVLNDKGTLWLNLGDSYSANWNSLRAQGGGGFKDNSRERNTRTPGFEPKNLLMIPSRVAIALQSDGWCLRAAAPWIKRNCMPDPAKDRPTTTIEWIFLLSKSQKYYYDAEAVKVASTQPDRKRKDRFGGQKYDGSTTMHSDGSVFTGSETRLRRSSDWFFESWQGLLQDEEGDPLAFVVNTKGFKGAHFATFPEKLVEPCILAGCPEGGVVLDPFFGAGTVGVVAKKLGRQYIGFELNPDYTVIAEKRIAEVA